ncbi:C39 family peptidase [Reichenbachiella carrageenanivorans]|uniref:C39 family peptidase n=1 Tax=Reichenbachiella carrageenanivorans TaxID=2979869 RepID=A0ABY6CVB5_9BACT|nr:C39 family peptidase [Reichenbachiella carrageenanivorans]UXX77679.1 C39 family peptidase [Reichenbachiella carrageenanivorans]
MLKYIEKYVYKMQTAIKEKILDVSIKAQPNDVTCGPTCLHGVYSYYKDVIPLHEVIEQVEQLSTGGTLAVLLGIHALDRGYDATIYTFNLHVFDPSWFKGKVDLVQKLEAQMAAKPDNEVLIAASQAYLTFLSLGGKIKYESLTPALIRSYLAKDVPVLSGLSATYLYDSPREIGDIEVQYDDIKGEPTGHFVILNGYNPDSRQVYIADPLKYNPISDEQYYKVSYQKLITSVMLGVVTYDANLLMIAPKEN